MTSGRGAVVRALAAWAVLCVALGVAVGVSEVVGRLDSLPAAGLQLLQGAIVCGLAVPMVLWLHTRRDDRPVTEIGLSRRPFLPVVLGLGVGAATGLLAWAPAVAVGWVRVDEVDPATFGGFLLLNGVALALFEALPEEVALRGYAWTNLRDVFGAGLATAVVTLLFSLTVAAASVVAAALTRAAGVDGPPVALAPDDAPGAYLAQLVLFGLALVAARRLPVPGALLVAVAFHWMQLTMTRAVLGGSGWVDSGWDVTFVEPLAVALVLGHVVLGGAAFMVIRKRLERSQTPRPLEPLATPRDGA